MLNSCALSFVQWDPRLGDTLGIACRTPTDVTRGGSCAISRHGTQAVQPGKSLGSVHDGDGTTSGGGGGGVVMGDPSGFAMGLPHSNDEASRGDRYRKQLQQGRLLEPKPIGAKTNVKLGKGPGRDGAMTLDRLSNGTRVREFESIREARGARHHSSEVYSPPCVTEMAKRMGLQARYALGFITRAPDGKLWGVSLARDRIKCWSWLERDRPYRFIGSPPCIAFNMFPTHASRVHALGGQC